MGETTQGTVPYRDGNGGKTQTGIDLQLHKYEINSTLHKIQLTFFIADAIIYPLLALFMLEC